MAVLQNFQGPSTETVESIRKSQGDAKMVSLTDLLYHHDKYTVGLDYARCEGELDVCVCAFTLFVRHAV